MPIRQGHPRGEVAEVGIEKKKKNIPSGVNMGEKSTKNADVSSKRGCFCYYHVYPSIGCHGICKNH